MEPERRIEKWLRAFAKKRREQAGEPMELRPATRQLLQREIARQSSEKSRGGFFFNFYPRLRLVFAACFTALLIGGWFLWRESIGSHPAELSMNKTSYPETVPTAPAPETPPPAASPSLANADKKVPEEKVKSAPSAPQPVPTVVASANRALTEPPKVETRERDRPESTATQKQLIVTTAASAPTTNTVLAYKNETALDSLSRAGEAKDAAGAFPPDAAPPAGSSLIAGTPTSNANAQTALAFQKTLATPSSTNTALFDLAKGTGAVTVSQMFNRLAAPSTQRRAGGSAGAVPTPAPVLASFRVEQNGNNLKVIDADGSIYTGSVQIAQQEPSADHTFAAAKKTPVGAATRSLKAQVPKPPSYFFRVAGTNQKLNETVVFSGNFVPYTNDQLTVGAGRFGGFGGGGGTGGDQAASRPIQAVLSNSEINGNVVIGDQKAVNVIATPAR